MFLFCFLLLLVAGASSATNSHHGRCHVEEEQRRHESDPQKFFKCVNRRWTLEICQINYIYDHESGFCVFVSSPTISPPHRFCRPGERIPYVFDNRKFQECTSDGRRFIIRSCHPGAVFVEFEGMCMNIQTTTTYYPPTRTTQWPTTTTTPYYGMCQESGGRDGYKPDIYNCKNFYKCASGLWTQMSCGEGTIWDQSKLTCDHNRGQCRPIHPTISPTYQPTRWPTHAPTVYPNEFKK